MGNRSPRGAGTARASVRSIVALLALVPLLVLASVTSATPAGAAPVGTVETVPLGPGITGIDALTAGPDGNTWFVSASDSLIGKITPAGVVTTYTHPELHQPVDIVAGPDGYLWFVDRYAVYDPDLDDGTPWSGGWTNGWIGRITPAGAITVHRDDYVREPSSIVAGTDGKLWFIDSYSDLYYMDGAVGSITTTGVIDPGGHNDDFWNPEEIELDSSGRPWAAGSSGEIGVGPNRTFTYAEEVEGWELAAGNQDTMWFIGRQAAAEPARILRFSQPNPYTVDALAPDVDGPVDLLSGRDGSVWFAAGSSVGTITPTGEVTTIPTPGATPDHLSWGPDGNVWFVDGTTIGRVTPAGDVDLFTAPFAIVDALELGGDGYLWFRGAGASVGRIVAADLAAPIFVEATAGRQQATITWKAPPAPTQLGGYTLVTATPGGATCQTGTSSCTITSLEPGTPYTFTASWVSNIGNAVLATSAPSNAVVPWSGSTFHPVAPTRILDSRPPGIGFAGPVTSGTPRTLQVAGLGGSSNVPTTASAVVMNVTVTDSNAESFLTVYPSGSPQPNASNLNFGAGQVNANLVTVKLPGGNGAGKVDIATAVGSTNVVADVVGWYDDGAGEGGKFVPVVPERLLDTRVDPGPGGGESEPVTGERQLTLREPFLFDEDMVLSVPWTAGAAVVNVTIVDADAQSFVRLTPQYTWSSPPPGWGTSGAVSNLNFLTGQIVANLAIVGGDSITITNAVGNVHVIVDLVGYFDESGGARFHGIEPNRVLDTRTGKGLAGAQGPNQTRALAVAGATGTDVPAGATGLVANVTAADATALSYASVFPGDVPRPDPFSNLNFGVGQVVPNLVTVGLAPNGSVNLYNNSGQTHLIADAVGWYAPW